MGVPRKEGVAGGEKLRRTLSPVFVKRHKNNWWSVFYAPPTPDDSERPKAGGGASGGVAERRKPPPPPPKGSEEEGRDARNKGGDPIGVASERPWDGGEESATRSRKRRVRAKRGEVKGGWRRRQRRGSRFSYSPSSIFHHGGDRYSYPRPSPRSSGYVLAIAISLAAVLILGHQGSEGI